MSGHFRAFSFVDRIISDEPGKAVRGIYQIPSNVVDFSRPLIAESVGQLAAWSAMAAMDFKVRPVAGIAAKLELLQFVCPGQTLELVANLDAVDVEAISYCGEASVNGVTVIRLNHCVGPMVPQEDFDDPQAVKTRYATLSNGGVAPGAYAGVPPVNFENLQTEPGRRIQASLPIPTSALFFDDHFARRPVFPGTLFMQKALELCDELLKSVPSPNGAKWVANIIADGKLRAFIPPGDRLEYDAKITRHEGDEITVAMEARRAGRISGNAKLHFRAEPSA